jgi:hypothetical protein
MRTRSLLALAIAVPLTANLRAQVPDGWYVISSFKTTNPVAPGDGGLFLVHPRTPGLPIPVTGLGSDLTGAGTAGIVLGADSVLRRSSDGALIVGERGPAGTAIDLHLITLAGSAVASDVTYPVGVEVSPFGGGITQTAILPSGEVLVGVFGIGSGPLAGASLGTVSPASGTVTAVPVTLSPGVLPGLNALCLDSSGFVAYFGNDNGNGTSTVYSVPVPAGGTASLVATLPALASNLAFRSPGLLVATCLLGPPNLFEIDLSATPATVTAIPTPLGALNGLAMESVTSEYAVVSSSAGTPPVSVFWMTPVGIATWLSSGPPGGWGLTSGISIDPNPEAYGSGTPGTTTAWALSPNPGGLPTLGNCSFSLTLNSPPPPPAASFYAASLAAASIPNFLGLGITLLVDPAQIVVLDPLPPTGTIPLCIPNDPALLPSGSNLFTTQGQVFFQVFHVGAGGPFGITASEGLRVTVL